MLKKLNSFFNIVIGSFIGVFIGFGIYKFWHFNTYPNLYAMQSAPWYTELLLNRCPLSSYLFSVQTSYLFSHRLPPFLYLWIKLLLAHSRMSVRVPPPIQCFLSLLSHMSTSRRRQEKRTPRA